MKEEVIENGIQGGRNVSEPWRDSWPVRSFWHGSKDKGRLSQSGARDDSIFLNLFFLFFCRVLLSILLPHC